MADALTLWIRAKNTTAKVFRGVGIAFVALVGAMTAAAAGLTKAIAKAFEFERYRTQFKILFGDLEQAQKHIKDLQTFSAQTPFQFGDIAQASRSLNVFTDGVMGGTASLKLVGDAAAASGNDIKDLAFWVGRAYSAISSGRPFGEAAMRLQEMGVLSGQTRGEIEDLTKAGATNAEIWGVVQASLEKSEGGMEELSTTGEGLISTMKDNWALTIAKVGEKFVNLAKDNISGAIEKLKELQKDGSLDVWADSAVKGISNVGDALGWIGGKLKGLRNDIEESAEFWGTLAGGGSIQDAANAKGTGQRHRADIKAAGAKNAQAEAEAAAEAEIEAARKVGEEKKRIAEDLAAKQKALDDKKRVKEDADRKAKQKKEEALIWKLAVQEFKGALQAQRKAAGAVGMAAVAAGARAGRANQAAQEALGDWQLGSRGIRARLQAEHKQEQAIMKGAARARSRFGRGLGVGHRDAAALRILEAREAAAAAKAAQDRLLKQQAKDIAKIRKNEEKLLALK